MQYAYTLLYFGGTERNASRANILKSNSKIKLKKGYPTSREEEFFTACFASKGVG